MIPALQERPDIATDLSAKKELRHLQLLIDAINRKTVPATQETTITELVQRINQFEGPVQQLGGMAKQTHKQILELLEKDLKIVPQKHYTKKWMVMGMALGLPFGVVFATALDN